MIRLAVTLVAVIVAIALAVFIIAALWLTLPGSP